MKQIKIDLILRNRGFKNLNYLSFNPYLHNLDTMLFQSYRLVTQDTAFPTVPPAPTAVPTATVALEAAIPAVLVWPEVGEAQEEVHVAVTKPPARFSPGAGAARGAQALWPLSSPPTRT